MIRTTPKCTTCKVKNLSFLRNCSNEILEELSEKKNCIKINKGERLLTEGDEAKSIYCIRSGVVKSEVHKHNNNLILRLEGKGAIVGYRHAGKRDKQLVTVTAVENMQVCQLSAEKFRFISQKCQSLRTEIMKSLITEMQTVERQALSLVHNSVKERVALVLLHIAEIYRYRQGGCSIRVQLDRQDMADFAGTTKEQVSTALAELHLANLVNFKAKHFKYFDLNGLRKIAGCNEDNNRQ